MSWTKLVAAIHHLLNPHCVACGEEERIRSERKEEQKICQNCEYLKLQLEKIQELNKELIDKLTNKPETPVIEQPKTEPIVPRFIPWRVRRQMLEAEDRVKAQKEREAAEALEQAGITQKVQSVAVNAPSEVSVAPADDPDVIALEQEMDLIAKERSAQDVSAASGGVKFNAR